MAWSGRKRHRDRDPGRRQFEDAEPALPDDAVFEITEGARQEIAQALRYIDEARRAIEAQHNPDNREIIRELKASADRIYEVLNSLEAVDGEPGTEP
jgi:DNA-binding PadR family transcriptional regulator